MWLDLFYVPYVDQIVQKYCVLQNLPAMLKKFIDQQQDYAQTMIKVCLSISPRTGRMSFLTRLQTGTEIALWQQDSKDESHNHKCDIADERKKECVQSIDIPLPICRS